MKEIKLEINDKEYIVNIESFGAYDAKVKVNDRTYDVKLKDLGLENAAPISFTPAPAIQQAPMSTQSAGSPAPQSTQAAPSAGGASIQAPMPGLILKINTKVGDAIKSGQTLMVMEAMKMENNIDATSDGTVKNIAVKEGDNVSEGDVLITIG